MLRLISLTLLLATSLAASPQTAAPAADPLAPFDFLLGTWTAHTTSGSAAADVDGSYTFRRDLNGHTIDRSTSADRCSAPGSFDCSHHDHLTIFSDPNALAVHHASLFAFYIDSEGHVIYYTVSLPDPHTAVFLSQGPPTLPHFRLTYHLEGSGPSAVLSGKFQMAPPGSSDFHSYLEWSGPRQELSQPHR